MEAYLLSNVRKPLFVPVFYSLTAKIIHVLAARPKLKLIFGYYELTSNNVVSIVKEWTVEGIEHMTFKRQVNSGSGVNLIKLF